MDFKDIQLIVFLFGETRHFKNGYAKHQFSSESITRHVPSGVLSPGDQAVNARETW